MAVTGVRVAWVKGDRTTREGHAEPETGRQRAPAPSARRRSPEAPTARLPYVIFRSFFHSVGKPQGLDTLDSIPARALAA